MQEWSLMLISSCALVWRMITSCVGKLKAPVVKQNIVWIGVKSLTIFPSWLEEETNGLSFFALEGKIEQWIRTLAWKQTYGRGLLKQQCPALTSSTESCDKHLNPPTSHEIGQMDNRNQTRWVYFLNFILKSNILFHCMILSFIILNSIQCIVERSNSQWPNV